MQLLGYQDGVFTIDAQTLLNRIKAFKDSKTYQELGGGNNIIQGKEREAWTLITKGLILYNKSSVAIFLKEKKSLIDTTAVNQWAATYNKQSVAQTILKKIFSGSVTSGRSGSANLGRTVSGTSTGSDGSGSGKSPGGSTATEIIDY